MAIQKFYVKDIPYNWPIFPYMREKTGIKKFYTMPATMADPNDLIKLKHDFNIDSIVASTLDMVERFGFNPWLADGKDDVSYGGLSLVYNPDYTEQDVDINQQTLGTRVNKIDEFFYAKMDKFKNLRNSYFDSYAFRRLAPCITESGLNEFAKSFKRHITRSRLGTIQAKYVTDDMRKEYLWHRDELVFENLRINIPIVTDQTFLFEIEGKNPVHLQVGNIYSWDTNIPHRVFPTIQEDRSRTHLVFGFSPWFDYDIEEDCFYTNEFYGEMHPIDMLISGHIHEKIKGILTK